MGVKSAIKMSRGLEKKIEQLEKKIQQNNTSNKGLAREVYSILPQLVDYVIELAKDIRVSATLSNDYPTIFSGNSKSFEVSYVLLEDGIYMDAVDPDANSTDLRDSFMDKVSKKEFLEWVEEDYTRAVDTYNHMVKYLKRADEYKRRPKIDKKELEAMMKVF